MKEERDEFLMWNSNTEDLLLLPETDQTIFIDMKVVVYNTLYVYKITSLMLLLIEKEKGVTTSTTRSEQLATKRISRCGL